MKKIDYLFKVDGFYESVNYYRSELPFDLSNMPVPLVSGISGLSFQDTTAVADKTYYVVFGSVKAGSEKFSNPIQVRTYNASRQLTLLNNNLIDEKTGTLWLQTGSNLTYELENSKYNLLLGGGTQLYTSESYDLSLNNTSTIPMVIEFEFYLNVLGRHGLLMFGESVSNNNRLQIMVESTTTIGIWRQAGAGTGGGNDTIQFTTQSQRWYKVRLTVNNSGQHTLYIDDIQVAQFIHLTTAITATKLRLGVARTGGAPYYLNGKLRKFKAFHNRFF